jgi:hypothetical protein
MQIARTLAQKIAITVGVAAPLLSGIAVASANVTAGPAVAPTVIAMTHNATPLMTHN